MFKSLTLLAQDPIYGMQAIYKQDARDAKINLSIGICLDETGKLLRFKAVDEAETRLSQKRPSKEYLPISGHQAFCEKAQNLVIGDEYKNDFFTAQTVGGTGALFVAAHLLLKAGINDVFISEPSWPNHRQLFQAAGFNVRNYPYYDPATISLEFDKLVKAIEEMPEGASIVLQASCHNPTGIDPSYEQWQALSRLIKRKKIFPIFDLAYMGLGDGVREDTECIRIFLNDGHDLIVCTTFAKSMGLYNDRLGFMSIKTTKTSLDVVASHIRSIMRTSYSSPPAHGAHIANIILGDDALKELWILELKEARIRLEDSRKMLYKALSHHNCRIGYTHILNTKGLFCLLEIPLEGVNRLRDEYGIYVALDGRIALAAVTRENVDHVAMGISTL